MDFTLNGYALVLLFFGMLTAIMAIYIYRRGTAVVRWFGLMMGSNAIWSIAYGLELSSKTLDQALIFINIEYIGIATLPLNWFLFCLSFCNKDCWYKKPLNLTLILIAPITTLVMVWTNPLHHLHYKDVQMFYEGAFPMAKIYPGTWYHIFTGYFYLLLACGCYLILNKFRTSDRIYKKQNYSIIIGAIIPWIANMSYLLGIRPLGFIDVTPFAFIFTTFLVFLGIYRFRLFDIIPIAREKAMELMSDGFLVLDDRHRIIDYNSALLQFISIPEKEKVVGLSIETIFPKHPELIKKIEAGTNCKMELQTTVKEETVYFEAEILVLHENRINDAFTIIKLQDLTSAKKDALIAKEQALELEKVNQLKDRIFSIIAHDLRGPLVNLSEVLKMVSYNQISDEEFKALSPILSKDIVYTTDLLENILHWSRSQLQGFGVKKEFFNVRNIIMNEINYHLPSASLKKVKILHDVFPNEIAYADLLMFQIVIRNLLNNAIKFCNEGCEILITAAYQKDGMIKVCIKDSGIGISKATIEKLFKEENISSRGTKNEKGTGLGLMICKDFMSRNGGDISVSSELGIGTTFCVTVPTHA
ncbi:histidine kinase N-terminal 7TM domain-containing protein [Pedobacter xixiisoli]|uniref:histidine kinase n=1 Tax=Pedobacter xixiisoli TaxID=1476464 RepID=A0A285ZZI5_9SPHI|nr:histidine kinase N-terminal 7TM domain-containing protein [Pedobacter xixiisoli]SOD15031.1 PAS/PAC sensor signal transduction histidine kinase [Pedobacter xixiisoli]